MLPPQSKRELKLKHKDFLAQAFDFLFDPSFTHLATLSFNRTVNETEGRKILNAFLQEAEKITKTKIMASGLLVQGIERTHAHLLLQGYSGSLFNPVPTQTAWQPGGKRGYCKIEPIKTTVKQCVDYLIDPIRNLKIQKDDSYFFFHWKRRLLDQLNKKRRKAA